MQNVSKQTVTPVRVTFKKRLAQFVMICFVGESLLMPIAYAQTKVNAPQSNITVPDDGAVTLSFSNADIESVASVLAKATGQTILVDPKVKGTINLISQHQISKYGTSIKYKVSIRIQDFRSNNIRRH